VRRPRAASASPSAADTVDFPTPPLPVTIKSRLVNSDITAQDREGDPLRQTAARRYGRARRRVALADTAAGLVALVALVVFAGDLGGVASLLLLGLGLPLISLPFGLIRYRMARRVGLSRQTPGDWLVDWLKGVTLGLALGAAAVFTVLAFQRLSDAWWPVMTWAAALLLSAALSVLFPVLLLPIFLRSEPMPEGPLRDALRRTVADAGVAVRDIRLLHLGDKTSAANAMVAGLGPTRRIYIGDTLSADAPDEAVAETQLVLAHELGHHVNGDPWRLLAWAAVSLAVGVAGGWAAVEALSPDGAGELTALPALALGFSLATAAVSPLGNWYSRHRERAADAYAVAVTGEGERYARALERLVAQNLSEIWPPRLWHALSGSHPRPGERIERARGNPSSRAGLD
jgi:STE24 endopeptidase